MFTVREQIIFGEFKQTIKNISKKEASIEEMICSKNNILSSAYTSSPNKKTTYQIPDDVVESLKHAGITLCLD